MKKRVSQKDIAEKVGVSTALVSYVLNNQKEGRISKEIAAKIKAVAKRMNYRTNQLARSLKTNKTDTIGLIIADISNPFFSTMARVIEDEVDKKNNTVIFGSSDENIERFKKLVDTFVNRQVDGLIIAPPENSEAEITYLQKQQVPFVLIDRYFPSLKTDYVVLDNVDAAQTATAHLLKGGAARPAFITYNTTLTHINDRATGYLAALKEAKISFKKNLIRQVDMINDQQEIEKAVDQLLKQEPAVDAILCASNNIANYTVKYLHKLNVKIPDTISVICFDETQTLDMFYAPVTYVQQPLQQLGETAINILLEKIGNDKKKLTQVFIKSELIIRKSGDKNSR